MYVHIQVYLTQSCLLDEEVQSENIIDDGNKMENFANNFNYGMGNWNSFNNYNSRNFWPFGPNNFYGNWGRNYNNWNWYGQDNIPYANHHHNNNWNNWNVDPNRPIVNVNYFYAPADDNNPGSESQRENIATDPAAYFGKIYLEPQI